MSAATRYLTVKEVATLARCEHKTVRRAIAAGRLQAFRPAGRLLVREDDARAWVEGSPARLAPAPSRAATRGRSAAGSVAKLREMERQQHRP